MRRTAGPRLVHGRGCCPSRQTLLPRRIFISSSWRMPLATAAAARKVTPDVIEYFDPIPPPRPQRPLMTPPSPDTTALYKVIPAPTLRTYIELAKPQLSILVVLTAMSSYALAPFSAAATLPSLVTLTVGTSLCSASANAFNQWVEPTYDAQMARTRNRPLPRAALFPYQAFTFASVTGVMGVSTLYLGLNLPTALLGLTNIGLYAGVYTYLKRVSISNTWVGSIVGAIPPLMGWAACAPDATAIITHPAGLCLAGILFAWQFPHFNSLAWNMRAEYARAGYRMTSVTHPDMNARVALRWSLACFPLSWGLVACGTVVPAFAITSSIVNLGMAIRAYQFWRQKTDNTARKLFFASIMHLPALLCLAMLSKTTLWESILF